MPFDKIDQKDINENLKTAGTMKKSLDAAVKEKDDLLHLFRTELKKLEGSEESLASMVKNSFSVCDYQETLKKQIEGNKMDQRWRMRAITNARCATGSVQGPATNRVTSGSRSIARQASRSRHAARGQGQPGGPEHGQRGAHTPASAASTAAPRRSTIISISPAVTI